MKKRRTYTDKMKRESAPLVVDQSYSIGEVLWSDSYGDIGRRQINLE